jgi:molybdopterin converting factor subunit 1
MQVMVKLFATFRDRVNAKEVPVEIPDGAPVAALKEQLEKNYPTLTPAMGVAIFAVNRQFAALDTPIHAGDEVALFPPVSGG